MWSLFVVKTIHVFLWFPSGVLKDGLLENIPVESDWVLGFPGQCLRKQESHHEPTHTLAILNYEPTWITEKKNMGLDPRATSGVRMLDDLRPSNHQMLCSSQINWIWNHVWSTCNQWDHLKSSNSKTYTHLDHSRSIAHAPRLQNHLKQSASIIQTYATWCDMTTHAKSCKIN